VQVDDISVVCRMPRASARPGRPAGPAAAGACCCGLLLRAPAAAGAARGLLPDSGGEGVRVGPLDSPALAGAWCEVRVSGIRACLARGTVPVPSERGHGYQLNGARHYPAQNGRRREVRVFAAGPRRRVEARGAVGAARSHAARLHHTSTTSCIHIFNFINQTLQTPCNRAKGSVANGMGACTQLGSPIALSCSMKEEESASEDARTSRKKQRVHSSGGVDTSVASTSRAAKRAHSDAHPRPRSAPAPAAPATARTVDEACAPPRRSQGVLIEVHPSVPFHSGEKGRAEKWRSRLQALGWGGAVEITMVRPGGRAGTGWRPGGRLGQSGGTRRRPAGTTRTHGWGGSLPAARRPG
jgi:hypothetical protein